MSQGWHQARFENYIYRYKERRFDKSGKYVSNLQQAQIRMRSDILPQANWQASG